MRQKLFVLKAIHYLGCKHRKRGHVETDQGHRRSVFTGGHAGGGSRGCLERGVELHRPPVALTQPPQIQNCFYYIPLTKWPVRVQGPLLSVVPSWGPAFQGSVHQPPRVPSGKSANIWIGIPQMHFPNSQWSRQFTYESLTLFNTLFYDDVAANRLSRVTSRLRTQQGRTACRARRSWCY